VREHPIVVTEFDARRLRSLLDARSEASFRDQEHLHELRAELERALVMSTTDVPADVITMHARARVLDLTSGEYREYELVYPADADISMHRISVLAPLGTALLGYREGDEVEWEMPGGLRRLRIVSVTQPEATKAPAVTKAPLPAMAAGV
jgi:regulator of nucleoside diphosphate kinase